MDDEDFDDSKKEENITDLFDVVISNPSPVSAHTFMVAIVATILCSFMGADCCAFGYVKFVGSSNSTSHIVYRLFYPCLRLIKEHTTMR